MRLSISKVVSVLRNLVSNLHLQLDTEAETRGIQRDSGARGRCLHNLAALLNFFDIFLFQLDLQKISGSV